MKEIKINKLEANQTSFKYVKKYLNEAPLSFIEKLFRKKDVKINGHWVKKDAILKENDLLTIYVSDDQIKEFNKKRIPININFNSSIIYEDENILIINKRKGILVHEDKQEKTRTLTNEVISYLTSKNEYSPLNINGFTPAPAHRLDRNTSGLILFAKNQASLQVLEELFKEKDNIDKYYLCLVKGVLNGNGIINKPLLKDEKNNLVIISPLGKPSISEYKVIKNFKEYTLLEVKLITGRTHQIRVHFASINHPVIGDNKYGDFSLNKTFKQKYSYENQFLHSYKIVFQDIKKPLDYLSNKIFETKLNEKEEKIISSLE